MRRPLAAIATAFTATALLLTAGCSDSHEQGPAGTVVAKEKDRDCTTSGTGKRRHTSCDTDYELTTRDKAGDEHEFEVSSAVFDNCRRGSAYPGCIDR